MAASSGDGGETGERWLRPDVTAFEAQTQVASHGHADTQTHAEFDVSSDSDVDSEAASRRREQVLAGVDDLIKQTETLLCTQAELQEAENWQFITANGDLLEDDFRICLGQKVLSLIIQRDRGLNAVGLESIVVPNYILAELDEVFLWSLDPSSFANAVSSVDFTRVIERADRGRRMTGSAPIGGAIVRSAAVESTQRLTWMYRACVLVIVVPFIVHSCIGMFT